LVYFVQYQKLFLSVLSQQRCDFLLRREFLRSKIVFKKSGHVLENRKKVNCFEKLLFGKLEKSRIYSSLAAFEVRAIVGLLQLVSDNPVVLSDRVWNIHALRFDEFKLI
jgi:uncharacterized membrane protein YcfT